MPIHSMDSSPDHRPYARTKLDNPRQGELAPRGAAYECGSRVGHETPRLCLIDSDVSRGRRLSREFSEAHNATLEVLTSPEALEANMRSGLYVDVLLASLSSTMGQVLYSAIEVLRRNPHAEPVFFTDNELSPDTSASRALGIQRVLHISDFEAWIVDAVPGLVRLVRARKDLAAALRSVPAYPESSLRTAEVPAMPLALAERQFREAYVAALLVQTPNLHEAARHANIPYRTLCHIIAKHDLERPPRR